MLRTISSCPYCETVIAADWCRHHLVYNPDSAKPVCQHVVYINGYLTKWRKDFTRVEFTDSNVGYLSPVVDDAAFCDFDHRAYLHALQWCDPPSNPVDPDAEYLTEKYSRDCREECPDEDDPNRDGFDFEAFIIYADDAEDFFQACLQDWLNRGKAL